MKKTKKSGRAKRGGKATSVTAKKRSKQTRKPRKTAGTTGSGRAKKRSQTKRTTGTPRMTKTGRAKRAGQTNQAKQPRPFAEEKQPRLRPLEPEDFLTDLMDAAHPGAAPTATPAGKRGLGERIREARQMRGLTLEDLSSRSGIAVDALQRVESNRAIPPLGELIRLGKALEMKMGYFISEGLDRPMSVVRSESRRRVARRGAAASERYGYVYESLAPEKANRLMEPFLVTLMPTEFGELSNHDGQEFIFVLEGEVRVQVEKEIEILHPGDSVYYDSFRPHLVKCHQKEPAKILAVLHAGAR